MQLKAANSGKLHFRAGRLRTSSCPTGANNAHERSGCQTAKRTSRCAAHSMVLLSLPEPAAVHGELRISAEPRMNAARGIVEGTPSASHGSQIGRAHV